MRGHKSGWREPFPAGMCHLSTQTRNPLRAHGRDASAATLAASLFPVELCRVGHVLCEEEGAHCK